MSKYQELEQQLVEKFGRAAVDEWLQKLVTEHGEEALAACKSGDFQLLKEVVPSAGKLLLLMD